MSAAPVAPFADPGYPAAMTPDVTRDPPIRRRLPARYAAVLLPLVLSTLMTCIVSGISTLKNVGLSASFTHAWMSAWGVSWLIGFPALLVVLPIVRALVALVVEPVER